MPTVPQHIADRRTAVMSRRPLVLIRRTQVRGVRGCDALR